MITQSKHQMGGYKIPSVSHFLSPTESTNPRMSHLPPRFLALCIALSSRSLFLPQKTSLPRRFTGEDSSKCGSRHLLSLRNVSTVRHTPLTPFWRWRRRSLLISQSTAILKTSSCLSIFILMELFRQHSALLISGRSMPGLVYYPNTFVASHHHFPPTTSHIFQRYISAFE